MIELAKMIGITPVILSLIGRVEFWPPISFRPTTRFAYWTGIRRSEPVMKITKMVSPTMTATTAIANRTESEPYSHLSPVALCPWME